MKCVALTVGPQAVGKTTFCKNLAANIPGFEIVCRDDIHVELFGGVDLSCYGDEHEEAMELLWSRVAEIVSRPTCHLLLDTWNVSAKDRREITKRLKLLGAEHLEAWVFKLPWRVGIERHWERERLRFQKHSRKGKENLLLKSAFRKQDMRGYKLHCLAMNRKAVTIHQGFSKVRMINVLETNIRSFADTLGWT